MPKRQSITKLPKDIRQELDVRLRESSYSRMIEHAEWLATKGFSISKSAVHRYAIQMRNGDRVAAAISVAIKDENTQENDGVNLMLELASLRLREHRIIAKLRELGLA